jgi:hypothetical protein
MVDRVITRAVAGWLALGVPAAGLAQMGSWAPGSEIIGQSVQVETNGIVNTVSFDPGGVARVQTPGGAVVPATWTATGGQLCLLTSTARECWPYAQAFQAGQTMTLTSTCQSASRWTALGTNQPPVQQGAGERG